MIKKVVLWSIIISLICISMSGAVYSQKIVNGDYEKNETQLTYSNRISTQQKTNQIVNTAEKFLTVGTNHFIPKPSEMQDNVELPWIGKQNMGELLDWTVRIVYNGESFEQKVDMDIDSFKKMLEGYMAHPEYGKIYKFDVDSDPLNDIEVKIGFYWSLIRYPDGQDQKSLETRFQIRQIPSGNYLDDQDAEFEVWSEIHVNYGLIKDPKARTTSGNSFIFQILQNIINKRQQNKFPLLNSIFKRYFNLNDATIEKNADIGTLDADEDYISVGSGYRSPAGEAIPLFAEKRYAFAKGIDWNKGSIFQPTIFQHQMSPGNNVVGDDTIEMLYGFRAHDDSSSVDKFDIAFCVEFEPAVNLKTKFIPLGGYVYYFMNVPKGRDNFGGWTPRSQPTTISFTADINIGSGDNIPKLSITLDEISSDLAASSTKWFSIDILGINGIKYTGSSKFDVGIIVDVPGYFTEKAEIKGLPTSVKLTYGVSNAGILINPGSRFKASLGVYADLTMSSNIDKITVFYPRTESYPDDAPDAAFLVIDNIPSSNRVSAGGNVDISSGSYLNVDVSGSVGMTSSGSIQRVSVYYPKADWANDPDMLLLDVPEGLPSAMEGNARVELNVKTSNIMDSGNYIRGSTSHTSSSNIQEIAIYLPDEYFPNTGEPQIRFTELPARTDARGELYWGQLKGYGFASRNSQNRDPVEIDIQYGDFRLYDKLEIRDGQIYTRFKVANAGYFEFDTSREMLGNDLRIYNYNNGDQFLLKVDRVSADDLKANWDVDNSGDQLKINKLAFSGVIDTLKGLDIGLSLNGRGVSLELDWEIGEKGNFAIEVNQDDQLVLDFDDLFPAGEGYVLHGGITLDKNVEFDMEWKLDMGENAQNPGYIRINKYTSHANLKSFNLYFTIKDSAGEEAYGIDFYFSNPQIYLDLEWYFDVDDIFPPYVFTWLDVEFSASSKDVKILWTDLWPGSDNYGQHHWIDIA